VFACFERFVFSALHVVCRQCIFHLCLFEFTSPIRIYVPSKDGYRWISSASSVQHNGASLVTRVSHQLYGIQPCHLVYWSFFQSICSLAARTCLFRLKLGFSSPPLIRFKNIIAIEAKPEKKFKNQNHKANQIGPYLSFLFKSSISYFLYIKIVRCHGFYKVT